MKKKLLINSISVGDTLYGLGYANKRFSRRAPNHDPIVTIYKVSKKLKTVFYVDHKGYETKVNAHGVTIVDHWLCDSEILFSTMKELEEYVAERDREREIREYVAEKIKNLSLEDEEFLFSYFKEKESKGVKA